MIQTKCCKDCRLEKPADDFDRDKSLKSGIKSVCRACKRARQMALGSRPCKKCGVEFSGIRCLACAKAGNAEWRQENPERLHEYCESRKEKYWADPESWRARYRSYREKNYPRYFYRANLWRKSNPDKLNVAAANLSDSYVAGQLEMKLRDCPPELIELKRSQLEIFRATRALAGAIDGLLKEGNDV